MCFSAGASFGVGAVLCIVGAASVKKRQASSQIMFASIPLIFGLQQISEGFLWLALSNDLYDWQLPFAYSFLLIAQIVWPIWVPFSIMLLENDGRRRKILQVFLGIGFLIAAYLAYCLISYDIRVGISYNHIQYELDYPSNFKAFSSVLYFIPTVISPFISSIKKMKIIGSLILGSLIITKLFIVNNTISVWCFFAAVISIVVYLIIEDKRKV